MKMQERLLLSALVLLAALGAATPSRGQAAPARGAGPSQSNVADVLKAPVEGTEIRLRGRLVRQVGEGRYLLSDGSGIIRIDAVGTPLPEPSKITGQTTVEVIGEIESGVSEAPAVDVHSLTVISP
ncbi:NirD/YgiW/YdeI family stress tolerance protein [Aquabacterium sp. A7-Y]|uniref:NirD/YgiW/YdeI family stress tolerance protein n=1 Tax=Aquabacterium sp. A7-Y TaxID=1349605 RepID=UPI00223CAB0D|nr:NirD/YgiW/YdeI family stress tolerance protein [Aquabacterium sp. A7-Y]MCW7538355.1 NirD/YgiW/YdeI family stress tolerance protein [Aquabacterium sp. A7-Y]